MKWAGDPGSGGLGAQLPDAEKCLKLAVLRIAINCSNFPKHPVKHE